MAAIPCSDYVRDDSPVIPERPRRTNPDAIFNRWANFVASLDLTPAQVEEVGAGFLAWTLWDIPTSHCAQIDDDRGEDLICVAVENNVYWLDWRRYQDEWQFNAFAPINHFVRFSPIPATLEATESGGYDLTSIKRFREFTFTLRDGAVGAAAAKWWITVGERDNEERTSRTAIRRTTNRMRTHIAVKGRSFVVTLEHRANEPINIESYTAEWDTIGKRIRQAGIVRQ